MTGLDPDDSTALRALAHRMIDDIFADLAGIGDRPVWQKMPAPLRTELRKPLPQKPCVPEAAYAEFERLIRPYGPGNTHPRFMGWVHGGGTIIGVLAEMLAAGLNANLGGRDHAPIEVERQVIRWAAEMLGFPESSGGVLVTGTSIANFVAVICARTAALGTTSRRTGIDGAQLRAYTSDAVHGCVPRALDMAGLGSDALRRIPCTADHRMDLQALAEVVARDRRAGNQPFLVVGTAGTVNMGAIDDLAALADFCGREKLWFHVDAAYAALAMLAPSLRPLFAGIEHADSVAFDFHKWAQVPYDAGCVVARDAKAQRDAFTMSEPYLRASARGLAAGDPWPCDLGPDLSRGFRALKVWLTFQVYGVEAIGAAIERSCALARYLAARIDREPLLERLAPVPLNIVCFRFKKGDDLDRLNADIVADIQEAGIAAPSTTSIKGKLAIRAALFNHRTREEDVDMMVDAVLDAGRRRTAD